MLGAQGTQVRYFYKTEHKIKFLHSTDDRKYLERAHSAHTLYGEDAACDLSLTEQL